MAKWQGKFRIIVTQEFEAPDDKDQAKKVGEEIAMKIYRENEGFEYVELAGITQNENPVSKTER